MAPEIEKKAKKELVLPLNVVTKADIVRLARELETLEDYFHQAGIRSGKVEELPKVSAKLRTLAADNNLNLILAPDRAELSAFMTRLTARAPVVHMSFPAEASAEFTASLLKWFRTSAHPQTLLKVGLQPELAAGFVMRTTNKAFDFSLRAKLNRSKEKLVNALEAAKKSQAETAEAAPTEASR